MTVFTDALVDQLNLVDPADTLYGFFLSEAFHCVDTPTGVRAQASTITDVLNLTDPADALLALQMFEQLNLIENHVPSFIYGLQLSDLGALIDKLVVALPAAVVEPMTLTQTEQVQLAVQVIEQLGLTDILLPGLIYHLDLTDVLKFTDFAARFFGADITEQGNFTDVAAGQAYLQGLLTEQLTLTDTLTPQFVLRVTASDTLTLTDTQLIKMLFSGAIVENATINAAVFEPSGAVTTWAMNTRNQGVTEYKNYDFNSFARIGGRYFGASASGLYELDGPTDDGTSIVADIASGFAQWSGTHLGSFKAAYIATRGAADFILRIVMGDGGQVDYAVTTESMRSTKVHVGKGLRTRYFAFELISTGGQDFDLDTLEFIPVAAQRRV